MRAVGGPLWHNRVEQVVPSNCITILYNVYFGNALVIPLLQIRLWVSHLVQLGLLRVLLPVHPCYALLSILHCQLNQSALAHLGIASLELLARRKVHPRS